MTTAPTPAASSETPPREALAGTPCSVVSVAFEWSTGNAHIDHAIEQAAHSAAHAVAKHIAAEMARSMKQQLELLSKYPPPAPGTILRRGTAVDKVCQCGRVVTFPIHPQNAEASRSADNPTPTKQENV